MEKIKNKKRGEGWPQISLILVMVIKNYEKLFERLEKVEPSHALYDRIILAIKREKERQKIKILLFVFFSVLVILVGTIPFSWKMFINEIRNSGVFYFISAAVSDFSVFFNLWQEFSLAILESLPIVALVVFMLNMFFLLFVIRCLWSLKKRLLSYLITK